MIGPQVHCLAPFSRTSTSGQTHLGFFLTHLHSAYNWVGDLDRYLTFSGKRSEGSWIPLFILGVVASGT